MTPLETGLATVPCRWVNGQRWEQLSEFTLAFFLQVTVTLRISLCKFSLKFLVVCLENLQFGSTNKAKELG